MTSDRLRPLGPAEITGNARALYDAVVESPRAQGPGRRILVREDETLCGPFDAWLRSPGIGVHFERAGMALREETVMDAAVREVAVLTVARAWGVEFEFQVHAMVAKNVGVPESAITQLAEGSQPSFEREDLAVAYQVARELVHERRVSEPTFVAAKKVLGEAATVEVVTHVGFYQMVSGVLTAFDPPEPSVDVPAPKLSPHSRPLIDLFEAASTTRAVRRLREDPVTDEQLARIIKMASFGPSGGNRQPWRIIVVRDQAKKAKMQELYAPHWAEYASNGRKALEGRPPEIVDPTERILQAGDYLAASFAKVPAVCVFVFNPGLLHITDQGLDRPSVVGGASIYPAVQNFLLACRAEGLGSTLTTLLCEEEAEIRELLAIPDPWYPCAFLPVGYAVGRGHGPIRRRSIDKLAHLDQFDAPFLSG